MIEYTERRPGFIGSAENYEQAEIVIIGAPMDLTVSYRPGTRQGPHAIRQASHGLEEYSVDLDRDLAHYNYYDAGDVLLPFGAVKENLRRISAATANILAGGKTPFVLGGEHLISCAVIQEVAKKHPGLAVIHFDAHADLRDEFLGEHFSHATVMRRVVETIGSKNLYQFGIRSGTREEFVFARANTNTYIDRVVEPLMENLPRLQGRPVYVSLDIDVVDPSFAPGTGTPEPGGCSAREIIKTVHVLGQLDIVGFDLVEVSPLYDPSERTALLAAKLIREAIMSFGRVKS
ncbi:MAG: agmatinase [Desulfotomaculaceae bacterium]|nr:agmatinase [Desulfotomaculaceae bacterium]